MFAPIDPFASGMLDRPDGARLYWEQSGRPDAPAVLYLHGGPGGGLGAGGYRRRFDPERTLIVGFDQRGCGRSTPWAVDDRDNLDAMTTQALIADIEALRSHLGIERWLVHGVSWGSTLALAYALEHRDRVLGVVNAAVTTSSHEEVDWITGAMGRIFPEAFAELAALAQPGERIIEAVARILRHGSPEDRTHAAAAWDAWESTHISLDPAWEPGSMHEDQRTQENFALLVTHFWSHDGFLPGPARILDRIGELAGVPGVLIHGRRDISGPVITPYLLHRAWPGSRLEIVEEEGHGGVREMQLVTEAAAQILARKD